MQNFAAVMVIMASGELVRGEPSVVFREKIRPLWEKYCCECHGLKKKKGDLDLTAFVDPQQVIDAHQLRQDMLERVMAYEMPPPGHHPEMNDEQRQALLDWLRSLPKPAKTDCTKIASDRTAGFYKGYVMSRRLNRAEYNRTVRDLFGVNLHLENLLPADGSGGEGFDTSGGALFTSTIHIEKYLAAAKKAVETVLPDTTKNLPAEIKKARQRLLIAQPAQSVSQRMAASKIVKSFARRAWRRPVADDELERFLALFDRAANRGDGFVASVRLALQGVLISPYFLFLVEREPEAGSGGVRPLEALPLASRLSYFLWSTMPDEELLTLAENGQLLQADIYRQQIRRMLADPKADALGERFARQWLDLDKLGGEVRPDPKKFPEFDAALNEAMHQELTAFFNHIFRGDRSVLELIDSDYTFMNQRLSRIYGLKNISGSTMRKVALKDVHRGGVVGMPGIHALTSYPLRTSPVLRGRWVIESLLGDKIPPPPADVPALEEASGGVAPASLRVQLEKHRTKAECAACHNRMDPLGFGLENFDVLGRWRETDRGQPVDAKGTLPSGQTFTGPAGLKKILLERKQDVVRHLARKMTGYAFGRELNKFDECVIDAAMAALQKNEYRSSVLVEQIALSAPFRQRFTPQPDETK